MIKKIHPSWCDCHECMLEKSKQTKLTDKVILKMSYKITKYGDLKSGIEIPNTLFETKDKAYNFGNRKWGSGSYNVNGGWEVVEVIK